MPITTAIATIATNILTQALKTEKSEEMTDKQRKRRKTGVRALSGFLSLVSIIGTAWIMGDAIPTEQLGGAVETFVSAGVAFAGSQGLYFLKTRE